MTLETRFENIGSTLFIKFIGLMDYSTIDSFNVDIPNQVTRVVVDFASLEFIDSTGIGAVLTIIYDASERGLDVEFEGLHETVRDLFDTVGVFRVMESLQKRGQ